MGIPENRIGLSLSGGGYRAAAFHLGTLKKLHALQLLEKVEVISTISGGSIIGAYYCLHKDDFAFFEQSFYTSLQQRNLIRGVLFSTAILPLLLVVLIFLVPTIYLLFSAWAWISPILFIIMIAVLFSYQFKLFQVSQQIETLYDRFFYQHRSLDSLPESPKLVIGSTNLETARLFTFSKTEMLDSTYTQKNSAIRFTTKDFPLSRAVAASSAVPFAFTPITIDPIFFEDSTDSTKIHPLLVDGGVYDNQGIHKLVQTGAYQCNHIISSDASTGSSTSKSIRNTLSLLIETSNAFMTRIKHVQMVKDIYLNNKLDQRSIAFFSLGWSVENCIPGFYDNLCKQQIPPATLQALGLRDEWVEQPTQFEKEILLYLETITDYHQIPKLSSEELALIRDVPTSLTPISQLALDCLIKQAEALTELQIKLYCPLLLK